MKALFQLAFVGFVLAFQCYNLKAQPLEMIGHPYNNLRLASDASGKLLVVNQNFYPIITLDSLSLDVNKVIERIAGLDIPAPDRSLILQILSAQSDEAERESSLFDLARSFSTVSYAVLQCCDDELLRIHGEQGLNKLKKKKH